MLERLRDRLVIWLTTVGAYGTPQPNPVGFLWDGFGHHGRRLPGGVNVVVDFLCGMLLAAAIQAALIRRATEGGSYRITITLAQVTTFEMSLGLNDKAELLDLDALGPEHKIQQPNLVTRTTPFGEFTRLGSQVEMSRTPEFWTDPILVPIGSSQPEWLPKPGASREQLVA